MRALAVNKADEGGNTRAKNEMNAMRRQPTDPKLVVPGIQWRLRGIEDVADKAAFETPMKSLHQRSVSVPEEIFGTPTFLDESPEASVPLPIAEGDEN
jgi:hypothetical protein